MKRSVSQSRQATGGFRMYFSLAGFILVLLCLNVLAHAAPQQAQSANATTNAIEPNFIIAARFVPSEVSKLVFDTDVRPHWFELSDRFWYSYQTPDGTHYWVVDPVRKSRTPLFDNAKLAAQLSMLTDFPYDAQNLPIKNLKLVKKDSALQFDVEVWKDAVIPNEPKQAQENQEKQNNEETIQEGNAQKQNQQMGQRRENGQNQAAQGEEPKPETRKIYFEYGLATEKLTRLDGFEAPPVKPMWASISPDEKTIVFARGFNLYMMDAANYAKAAKNPGNKYVVET